MSEDLKEDMKPKAGSAGPDRAGRHGLPAGTNPRSRFWTARRSVARARNRAGIDRYRRPITRRKRPGEAVSGQRQVGPPWRKRPGARGKDQDCEGSNPMSAAGTASLGQAAWPALRATIGSEPLERGEEARRRAMLAGAAIDRRSGASIDAKDRMGNRIRPAPTRPHAPAGDDDQRRSGIARRYGNTGQRGAAGVC